MKYDIMEKSKTISAFVNGDYKRFSQHVCYNRAIPNLIDGFKPSQRKAFYILLNKRKEVKVQSVSGQMISDANYHPGDTSASEAICKMAQDFTGSNNIPPFIGVGTFGSKFVKESSAPRYIFVKPNPNFYNLFNDFELCEPDDDIENPEPKFYMPIIPTILLNGITGIAVGFACKILPYNILDIIDNVEKCLNGIPQHKMTPYFHDYIGEIQWIDDKPVLLGKYEIVNTTTIKVTEVPISYDREKYHKLLYKLESKNLINSFTDDSKTTWDITIKLPRKSKVFKDPILHLGLSYNLNENITIIDENGTLRVLNSVNDIIERFVKYRLDIYGKRIQHKLDIIKEETILTKSKMKFIIEMGQFDFRKTTKKQLKDHFIKLKFSKEHLEKCLGMAVTRLNKESLIELKKRMDELKKEYSYYKKITPKELYQIDLDNIKGK